jgi:hypothetical protein
MCAVVGVDGSRIQPPAGRWLQGSPMPLKKIDNPPCKISEIAKQIRAETRKRNLRRGKHEHHAEQ